MPTPDLRKITAVLPVESVEASLPFWQKAGLTPTVQVPHGAALGFAILSGQGVEVMLQSLASIEADVPAMREPAAKGHTFLFIEVGDIDAIAAALDGEPVVLPRRTTFYGATEIGYREPSGHFITFAQFSNDSAETV